MKGPTSVQKLLPNQLPTYQLQKQSHGKIADSRSKVLSLRSGKGNGIVWVNKVYYIDVTQLSSTVDIGLASQEERHQQRSDYYLVITAWQNIFTASNSKPHQTAHVDLIARIQTTLSCTVHLF